MLPPHLDPIDFDERFRVNPALWLEDARKICGRSDLVPFKEGSNLVAAIGEESVLKIFPPFHRNQWESEVAFFSAVHSPLPLRLPTLQKQGQLENGWTFIIVERLPGNSLEQSWESFSFEEKRIALFKIGQMMRQVHLLSVDPLLGLQPKWEDFLPEQIKNCKARHARLRMPGWFLEEVESFVQAGLALISGPEEKVILTGEYTPFNLLAENHLVSGMIDFGDVMVGPADYDLLGPSVFLCGGDEALVKALFDGYGIVLTQKLRHRLMLLMILHRYSNLRVQLRIEKWEDCRSLSSLTEHIWPMR